MGTARTLVVALLALVACGPAPLVGAELPGGGVVIPTTFSALVQDVLVPECGSCHAAGSSIPVALDSDDVDVAYEQLVGADGAGVPAQQAPLDLVAPGDPSSSYLVMKLRGTARDVGGLDTPMPPNGLTEAQIVAIEAWIANGAPND